MRILNSEIPDVKIIEPTVYEDERGYFFEAYNSEKFEELMGFCPNFCQSNESYSKKGTIRGLHLQTEPFSQAKLVRVIAGEVFDVAVDCRVDSVSFGKHTAIKLTAKNKRQLWIPSGFAHGFQVLSEYCVLNYQVTSKYCAEAEITINPFDKELQVNWAPNIGVFMSEKDRTGASFLSAFS